MIGLPKPGWYVLPVPPSEMDEHDICQFRGFISMPSGVLERIRKNLKEDNSRARDLPFPAEWYCVHYYWETIGYTPPYSSVRDGYFGTNLQVVRVKCPVEVA